DNLPQPPPYPALITPPRPRFPAGRRAQLLELWSSQPRGSQIEIVESLVVTALRRRCRRPRHHPPIGPPSRGRAAGRRVTATPRIRHPAPTIRESMTPWRHVFSRKNPTENTAIHTRFISPRTASTAIRGQQLPRQ